MLTRARLWRLSQLAVTGVTSSQVGSVWFVAMLLRSGRSHRAQGESPSLGITRPAHEAVLRGLTGASEQLWNSALPIGRLLTTQDRSDILWAERGLHRCHCTRPKLLCCAPIP